MANPAPMCRGEGAETQGLTLTTARKPTLLHEPFVSPEFGARADLKHRSSRPDGVVDGSNRGERAAAKSYYAGNENIQAAPLYTVTDAIATESSNSVFAVHPSAQTDSSLLGMKPTVAAAASRSVVGPALVTSLKPITGSNVAQYQPKVDSLPPQQSSRKQVKAKRTLQSPPNSPQDISSLVTEANCTWGQELGIVLGQEALHAQAKPRTGILSCFGRQTLTTTGLFPQMMTLRFSSSVRVTAVHLRVSSVLRLVVQPGVGLLGDGRTDGKAVTIPAIDLEGGSRGEESRQNVEVDLSDNPSFEETRSLTVIITAGSKSFCSIHEIYALGVRANNEHA